MKLLTLNSETSAMSRRNWRDILLACRQRASNIHQNALRPHCNEPDVNASRADSDQTQPLTDQQTDRQTDRQTAVVAEHTDKQATKWRTESGIGPCHFSRDVAGRDTTKIRLYAHDPTCLYCLFRVTTRNILWSSASVCLCVCVCLSAAACLHYCTDPVDGLRYYGNITRTLVTSLPLSRDMTTSIN